MIKANELRIGNWLYDDDYRPVQVVSISENSFEAEADEVFPKPEECEPVLLTPEILEKCGFESMKDLYIAGPSVNEEKSYISPFDRKRLILSFDDNGPGQINTYWIEDVGMAETELTFDIKSLHELQNLWFALKGEELTVNL